MTSRVRWWIGALLFLSTIINYIDRQTLSVLAPIPEDRATTGPTSISRSIVIAFRVAYAIGQAVSGRLLDRHRHAQRAHALGAVVLGCRDADLARDRGCGRFCGFRFLLGMGESANWPGGDQGGLRVVPAARARLGGGAVRQRVVGGRRGRAGARAVAVPPFGSWRPAFIITGALGFVWLVLWRLDRTTRRRTIRASARTSAR